MKVLQMHPLLLYIRIRPLSWRSYSTRVRIHSCDIHLEGISIFCINRLFCCIVMDIGSSLVLLEFLKSIIQIPFLWCLKLRVVVKR